MVKCMEISPSVLLHASCTPVCSATASVASMSMSMEVEEDTKEQDDSKEMGEPVVHTSARSTDSTGGDTVITATSSFSTANSGTSLTACPRCNHSYCDRHEWLSKFVPTLVCGSTITSAVYRYCCECGNFYATHSPVPATDRDEPRTERLA